jgi:hypothetical protein
MGTLHDTLQVIIISTVIINGSTVLCWEVGCFFSFLILYTDGRTPSTGDQPDASPLLAYRTTYKINMPRIGFKPTTPALEQLKTVEGLDISGDKPCLQLGIYIPISFTSKTIST